MRDNQRPESSADRIRRRLERLEESRRVSQPRVSPFTLISILVILVLLLTVGNMLGN